MSRSAELARRLVLPGLALDRTGIVLTTVALTAVLLSRLLLLPEGPWEQDEALFAAGVLDFDVTRHRPHPPGFPGWIALGKLLRPLAGDPVVALQVASSLASTVLFWAMAQLLARIVPGGRATALAFAFAMSPLAWVHAGRAFSTTPALGLAALGVLLLAGRGWTHRSGWVLLALAATTRPQLAPELAVLALLGVGRRTEARQGIALGAVVLGLGLLAVLLAGPSPSAVSAAFADHFGRHQAGLDRTHPWSGLGIVRGLGHPAVAGAWAAAVLVGLIAARHDRRRAAWMVGLFVVTAWMVLRQHHPGFPRYAVALLAASMPALGAALSTLPARAGLILCWALTLVGGVASLGPLLSMHARPLPVVEAARIAARDPSASALAYSHGVFSFARLEAERAGLPVHDVSGPDDLPALPPRAYAVDGRTLHVLDGVTACVLALDPAPERAMELGQGRFGRARVARDGVLFSGSVSSPERDDVGDRYAWLPETATLALPVGAQRVQLRFEVPDDVAGGRMRMAVGEQRQELALREGPMSAVLGTGGCPDGCRLTVEVEGRHVADDELRTLTVRLEAAWVEGPAFVPAYGRWSPGHPRTVRARDVALHGFESPETFARGRRGAWSGAEASASFPARPGMLRIRLARPEHTPGEVTVASDAEERTLEVGPKITTLSLRTEAPGGLASLRFRSPTFVPADVREGSDDTRALGLILYDVEFVPDADPCRPDGIASRL